MIGNLFQKTLSCVAERNLTAAITGYICTVTAQDIDGSGTNMNGEKVCLSSQGTAGDGTWYQYANGQIGNCRQRQQHLLCGSTASTADRRRRRPTC